MQFKRMDDQMVLGSVTVPFAFFGVSPKTLRTRICCAIKSGPNSEETGWRDASQSGRDDRATRGQNSLSHPLLITPPARPWGAENVLSFQPVATKVKPNV